MTRILLSIFTLLIGCYSAAALEREVVVLSSLPEPERALPWHTNPQEIIERKFRAAFDGSGYKLVIKHKVNQLTLEQYLTSDKTLALFWISHAAEKANFSKANGIAYFPRVMDHQGNDVAPLFQKLNPNLRWLSLIGCQGQSILKGFQDRGFYDNHPNLNLHAFKTKLSLRSGVDRALKASAEVLDSNPTTYKKLTVSGRPGDLRRRDSGRQQFLARQQLLSPIDASPIAEHGPVIEVYSDTPFTAQLVVDGHFLGLLKPTPSWQQFIIPDHLLEQATTKLEVRVDRPFAFDKIPAQFRTLDIRGVESEIEVDYFKDFDGLIYGKWDNLYYLSFL